MPKPGVLLLHGFTSHRSSLEALIPKLEAGGFDWHYPILAGHGTSPKDLRDKRWPDWYRDAESGLQYLLPDHEDVVIVALSMGALLGLELAVVHADRVRGLVLLSPCLRFYSKLSRYTPIVTRLLPRFPNPSPAKFSSVRYAVRDRGYQWFPTATFRSYWEHTHTMGDVVRSVRCPVRIIHSHNDHVAHPKGAQEIYDLLTTPKELLWHERSGHEILMDCETEATIGEVLSFPPLAEPPSA